MSPDAPERGSVPRASVSRNVVGNVLSEVLNRGSFFLASVWFAQRLGVEQFGLIGAAQAITMIAIAPVEMGLGIYGSREAAIHPGSRGKLLTEITTARLLLALGAWCVLALVVLGSGAEPEVAWIYLAAASYIPFNAMYTDWFARGTERFTALASAGAVSGAMLLVLTLALVHDSTDALVASALRPIATLCGGAVLLFLFRHELAFARGMLPRARAHVRSSAGIGVSNTLLAVIFYLATPLTAFMVGRAAAGEYEAGARLYALLSAGAMVIQSALFPRFAALYREPDSLRFRELHRRYQILMAWLAVALLLGAGFVADRVIAFIYPEQFAGAGPVLAILMVAAAADLLRYTYGSVLLACGFVQQHVQSSALAVISMVVAAPVLISLFGPRGAALSVLVASLVNLISLARGFTVQISSHHLLGLRLTRNTA